MKLLPELEKYKLRLDLWVNDKNLVLSAQEKQEILDIIKTRDPNYSVNLWCGHCVGQMLEYAFTL